MHNCALNVKYITFACLLEIDKRHGAELDLRTIVKL